jgi:hypothetical protein
MIHINKFTPNNSKSNLILSFLSSRINIINKQAFNKVIIIKTLLCKMTAWQNIPSNIIPQIELFVNDLEAT